MKPYKDVELLPKEWRSDREKPREPIFGSGAVDALAYGIGWIFTFSAIYYFTH
jgi:hypothetical protein